MEVKRNSIDSDPEIEMTSNSVPLLNFPYSRIKRKYSLGARLPGRIFINSSPRTGITDNQQELPNVLLLEIEGQEAWDVQ